MSNPLRWVYLAGECLDVQRRDGEAVTPPRVVRLRLAWRRWWCNAGVMRRLRVRLGVVRARRAVRRWERAAGRSFAVLLAVGGSVAEAKGGGGGRVSAAWGCPVYSSPCGHFEAKGVSA